MPETSGRVCYLVGDKANAIVSRIGLELNSRGSGPGRDRRLHPGCGPDGPKGETGAAGNSELTEGDIVVHVALPGMRLAPGVFMRGNVLSFGEVGRAGILDCTQVAHCHREPVGSACMGVAGVAICR